MATDRPTQKMDTNSLKAYESLDEKGRQKLVLILFSDGKTYTDREAAGALFGSHLHRALVQPRISEMLKNGTLEKVGNKICQWSGRRCRLIRLFNPSRPTDETVAEPDTPQETVPENDLGERRRPFREGESVVVPAIQGHISNLKSSGVIRTLSPPYARVYITYGKQTGTWTGSISELSRRGRSLPERRGIKQ